MDKLKYLSLAILMSITLVGCAKDKDVNTGNIDGKNTTNNEQSRGDEAKKVKFYSHSMDENYQTKSESYEVEDKKSVEENLKGIIEKVSKEHFGGAPLELVKIKNGVAYLNFKENDKSSWSKVYFQGSTGATITKYTIIENLLQRDYTGDWIKGIHLAYNDKTDEQFDHLGMDFFGKIIGRDSKINY